VVKRLGYEVLLMTEPVDAFMLVRMNKFNDKHLVNIAKANLEIPAESQPETAQPEMPEAGQASVVERFKAVLGDRVSDVRMTGRLADSPARLVDAQGALNPEMQRVYRLLDREYAAPKKVLELNPRHSILVRLSQLSAEDPRAGLVIEQIYEDALLIEGLHPDPAAMIARIQKLIEAALV
jgi:molecular chaperone HtpG